MQKKNLWHPAVANSTASLSASDDTSSVQLSPWQRDHCWKQSVPRRLRGGAGCTFHMIPRAAALQARHTHRTLLRRFRRRPYDLVQVSPVGPANGHIRSRAKCTAGSSSRLASVIQRMWELVKSSPNVFSPRKRILRDLERVCVVAEEPVKRQRPRPASSAGNSKGVSSYSITSLLGPREDEGPYLRNLLQSPSPKTPASETYPAVQPPYGYYPFQPGATQPPYYMTGSPSHSLWTPYPMSSLPRGAGGPYAALVTPYPSSHFSYPWSSPQGCQFKRDDTSSGQFQFLVVNFFFFHSLCCRCSFEFI